MIQSAEKFPYNPIHLRQYIETPEGIQYVHCQLLLTVWINFISRFCTLSFRWFSSSPTSIPLSFSPPHYPGSLRSVFLFLLTHSHTSCLLVSLLHHYNTRIRPDQLRIDPRKRTFISRLINSKKFTLQFNYSCLKHVSHRTKTCIGSLVSLVCSSKRWLKKMTKSRVEVQE